MTEQSEALVRRLRENGRWYVDNRYNLPLRAADAIEALQAREAAAKADNLKMAEMLAEQALETGKAKADAERLAEALVAHNEMLRSAQQIAQRDGEDTNWLSFRGQCTYTLAEYHELVNEAREMNFPRLRSTETELSTLKADAERLAEALEKIKAGYESQMKFCDIEPLPYFRRFVEQLCAALAAWEKSRG